MEVERIDLFDFKVTLTEFEFNRLKNIADHYGRQLEECFRGLIDGGIFAKLKEIQEKE